MFSKRIGQCRSEIMELSTYSKLDSELFEIPKEITFDGEHIEMHFRSAIGNLQSVLHSLTDDQIISAVNSLEKQLEFMHSRGIIHGDITSRNILVYDDKVCFTDFGLSVIIDDDIDIMVKPNEFATIDHRPPEFLSANENVSVKPSADVWSFAVMLLNIMYDYEDMYCGNQCNKTYLIEMWNNFEMNPGRKRRISDRLYEFMAPKIKSYLHIDPDMRHSFVVDIETESKDPLDYVWNIELKKKIAMKELERLSIDVPKSIAINAYINMSSRLKSDNPMDELSMLYIAVTIVCTTYDYMTLYDGVSRDPVSRSEFRKNTFRVMRRLSFDMCNYHYCCVMEIKKFDQFRF